MKTKLLSGFSSMVKWVASASAGLLCICIFHQPKVPSRLINK